MANVYVNFSLADGDNDGTTWANAFRTAAAFDAYLDTDAGDNDVVYVKESTWTLASACTAVNKTATTPVTIIGVKAATTNAPPVLTDWADANMDASANDDRPTFACGAYTLTFGYYYKVFNIRFTGTSSPVVASGRLSLMYNCKVSHDYNGLRTGLTAQLGARIIHCESRSGVYNGQRCFEFSSDTLFLFCRAYDGAVGYSNAGGQSQMLFCIAELCTTAGFDLGTRTDLLLINNSVHDCAIGFSATTSTAVCINNLLEGCTADGFKWTTQTDINFFLRNHGDDVRNTDMWDGVSETHPHADNWVTTGDPKYTGVGDLSLAADSPCIDAASALVLGVGV